jgi:hypothetical protein
LKLHNCLPSSDVILTEDQNIDFLKITCESIYSWQEIQDIIEEADQEFCQ